MLTHLHIQGLAIIDSLAIDFSDGFNVITGETGAGKSILIKALGLLFGAKSNFDIIRKGAETAVVTGMFTAPKKHPAKEILESLGLPIEEDGGAINIIIRRQFTSKGKSQAWINDAPVTLTMLKDLSSTLIDIFGQHENQKLLDPSQHILYIDQFLKDSSLKIDVFQKHKECHEIIEKLSSLIERFKIHEKGRDYLLFRFSELKNFSPSLEDFNSVSELCCHAKSFMTIKDTLQKISFLIDEGAGGKGISSNVWEASRLLSSLNKTSSDNTWQNLINEASDLASKIENFSYNISREFSSLDFDEGQIESSEERLASYQDLFRKLSVSDVNELLSVMERLKEEIKFLENAEEEVLKLLQEFSIKVTSLSTLTKKLTKKRQEAALFVQEKLEKEFSELAMPGSSLVVEFTPIRKQLNSFGLELLGPKVINAWNEIFPQFSELSETGAERASFLLTSNPGEPAYPLHKIASGGEISRIMLAFKRVLAAGADACVLVFDEIDTGISGRIADIVGQKIKDLSKNFQVICISHLPQVAAYANSHFLVHKKDKGQRTESTITQLSTKQSAEEIARLLSGPEITKPSLANAEQLIQRAKTQG